MDDIEELQDEAAAVGWDIRYTQHDAGSLDGVLKELRLPGLLVAHEVYGRSFFFCASLPKDFTPALFPLRPKEDVRLNGLPLDADNIVMPRDLSELACGGPQGVDLITLHLEPESMRDLAAMLGQNEFDDLLGWAMLRHRGDPQLRESFQGLLASLLQEGMWPATNANRMEAIRDRVLEGFAALLADAGPAGSPSRNVHRSAWALHATQARAYLDANLDRAVSLAELCRITGTSARTIQYAFRDRYGAAPQAYHRSRRLGAAQQTLKRRWPGETTVTDVALGHGFWHLGRFSQAYKMRFGESPSETLARRPASPGPASPFAYKATIASLRQQTGPGSGRGGKVLPFKKRDSERSEKSGSHSRRSEEMKDAAD